MAQGFWSLLGKLYPGRRWRVQGGGAPAEPGAGSQLLIEGGTDALLIEGGTDALLIEA